MTLVRRVVHVRGSYWLVVVGAMTLAALVGLAAGLDGLGLFAETVGVAAAVTVSWRPLTQRLLNRVARQHLALMEAAIADGDEETQRRLLGELDEYYRVCAPRSERQQIRLRANALNTEERYAEALAVLGEIDRDTVPANERPLHDNSVAWSCAHAGETARAVELARVAIDAGPDARMRPYLLGTLGAALVLDGQPAAALAPLREALALGGPRWAQGVRRYYLGQALAALGKLDEARAEWNESVTIAPKSRFGRRAQERLSAGPPAAYR